jgi:Flp pilus assembly protein TadG
MDEARMSLRNFWQNESGAGAAEFTIVLIPFSALVFGIIQLCTMFYANQTMQFATQAAARCFAVDTTNCGTPGAAQLYAAGKYKGPNVAPVFVADSTGCGHTVRATANFQLNAIVYSATIPLSANACFP